MQEKLKLIMSKMNEIKYGFVLNNKNIYPEDKNWDKNFSQSYFIQSPDHLLQTKHGVCYDQVELERYYFAKENIEALSFYIVEYDDKIFPTHTFIVTYDDYKYYWFEHSWVPHRGIHEYDSLKELLIDVKNKFIIMLKKHNIDYHNIFVYQYSKPSFNIDCHTFFKHCENSKLIKLNKPLYFYHLVNKNSDLSKGILSLKYMYDHYQEELFAKYTLKYQKRVSQVLNKDSKTLTNEDYLTWFNQQRGANGASYIYFFRYPPTEDLGNHMRKILKNKDIYCLNINDEEIRKNILDIFYGYDVNTKKSLDQTYYENITKEKYFAHYKDNITMNFSTINHIGIMFKDDYCPASFIKKVNK